MTTSSVLILYYNVSRKLTEIDILIALLVLFRFVFKTKLCGDKSLLNNRYREVRLWFLKKWFNKTCLKKQVKLGDECVMFAKAAKMN